MYSLDYFESIAEDTVGYLYNLGFVPTLDKNRAMQSFLRGGGEENPESTARHGPHSFADDLRSCDL